MTADVLGFMQALGVKGVKPTGRNDVTFSCVDKQAHKNGDRSPSATINTTTGAWFCHACQAKGRAYDLARTASLEHTAARELAERHGLWTENTSRSEAAIRSPRPAQLAAPVASLPVAIQVSTPRHAEPAPRADSPGSTTKKRTILETYDYVDEHGEHLFQSIRFEPKGFSQRRRVDGEWVWNLSGTRRVLYRLPIVIEAAKAGGTVYICEGEKDVHALEALGLTATCNPEGAGKWRAEYSEFLAGADIVVIADQDPIGKKHAEDIIESAKPFAKAVQIVNPRAGKDAHDHFAAGHTVDELIIEESAEKRPRGIKLYFQDDLEDLPEPEWYLPDLLPKGETGILFGPWGSRKSLIALDWACQIAQEHGLVVYVTPEGFRGVKLRFEAWREHHDVNRVDRLAFVEYAVQMRDTTDVASLAASIEAAAETRGLPVSLVIIDTLARSNAGGDENSTQDMTSWLSQADALRLQFGVDCTLLVLHHDGVEGGRPRGSSAIPQWVTFMLSAKAHPGETTELRVEKVKDSAPVVVTLQQEHAADSVVVVEVNRAQRGDSPTSTNQKRGPKVRATAFAGWLAECGGAARIQHAADQFGMDQRTIRRWARTSDYHQQGIRIQAGEVFLASSSYANGRPDAY